VITARLILRSVGYRGTPIDGVFFDVIGGVVPNDDGRVLGDDGLPVPGVYVIGWIKRGSRGVIGTNRSCAEQSVTKLWEDFGAGVLTREIGDHAALASLIAQRVREPVDWQGWCAIDAAERQRGEQTARPRVKLVDMADMLAVVAMSGSTKAS
jgi:ferredoxin/flavodoxin---NADP+ reductase